MIALVQRVSQAKLLVRDEVYSSIKKGSLVLLSISRFDEEKNIDVLVRKILHLKMFSEPEGKLDKSLLDIKGEVLLVSQFTLYADTKKGVKPSFSRSAPKEKALDLYKKFRDKLNQSIPEGLAKVATGKFGSPMKILPELDGPVSFYLEI